MEINKDRLGSWTGIRRKTSEYKSDKIFNEASFFNDQNRQKGKP